MDAVPAGEPVADSAVLPDTDDPAARYAAANAFLALKEGRFVPQGTITRQEMATVAMQPAA